MPSTPLSILPCVAAGAQLLQLLEEMREAPYDLTNIEKEISELCPILRQLHKRRTALTSTRTSNTKQPGISDARIRNLKEENEKNLAAVLQSCDQVLRETSKLVVKYHSRSKPGLVQGVNRMVWVMDGQRKAEKLKKRLEANKLTLAIAVGLITQSVIIFFRRALLIVGDRKTTEVTGETANFIYDGQQALISQIQSLIGKLDKEDISSVVAGAPSEHSFMLRRYLESASIYAKSTAHLQYHHNANKESGAMTSQAVRGASNTGSIMSGTIQKPVKSGPSAAQKRMAEMREALRTATITPESLHRIEEEARLLAPMPDNKVTAELQSLPKQPSPEDSRSLNDPDPPKDSHQVIAPPFSRKDLPPRTDPAPPMAPLSDHHQRRRASSLDGIRLINQNQDTSTLGRLMNPDPFLKALLEERQQLLATISAGNVVTTHTETYGGYRWYGNDRLKRRDAEPAKEPEVAWADY
ncbi:hypothetical protein BJ508DRAFT_326306 [Ascobolus immersus RN42]|uniref:Fungal N-terminal domain-containing protein n=1 Tax=Ascobolus immersus RN42 TaxID=1160509 RepID=A0A3N4IBT6_ASCIM|nr:hypothetical protein BJ508DRAFT_326306 [Ascobolus immersus RN42]